MDASRAARASAIWRAVSGEWGRVGEVDWDGDWEVEAWLDVDAGREGEREGALVEVEAEAEAEFDIVAVRWEVYMNGQVSKGFKS
jgi:hypothetical protein